MAGVSTRRVEDLVEALGHRRRSASSEVSRICAALDAEVEAFRSRSLADETLSRTCGSTRRTSRSARAAGSCRWRRSWRSAWPRPASAGSWGSSWPPATTRAAPGRPFLRALVERGLAGVRLVISDAHRGLVDGRPRAAPRRGLAALPGALHPQRPGPRPARRARSMVAIGHPDDLRAARRGSPRGAAAAGGRRPRPRFPAVAELLTEAEPDLLVHFTFPETHRRQIREHQPPGAAEQGDQAPDGGRRHLPDPGQSASASSGWSSPSRTTSGRTAGATSGPSRWPASMRSPSPRR